MSSKMHTCFGIPIWDIRGMCTKSETVEGGPVDNPEMIYQDLKMSSRLGTDEN
jgi:hypothetical protein